MRVNKSILNKIFWGIIFATAGALLADVSFKNINSKQNSKYYQQGLHFVDQSDYQNAYFNFSMVKKGNDFYCPAKYRAALSAQNLYDKKSAVTMYEEVINSCKNSIFEEPAKYNLAKLYYLQDEEKKARNIFEELSKNAKTKNYKIATNFFLGKIKQKNNPTQALNHYLMYLEKAPSGIYAEEITKQIQEIAIPLNSSNSNILALSLLKTEQYAIAKKYFSSVPIEKSWYNLAICEEKTGNHSKAISILNEGIKNYSNNVSDEEIQNAIDLFAQSYQNKKNGYYDIANALVPNAKFGGDYALYKYISYLKNTEKIAFYNKILEKYPNGRFASDASWNILYAQYKNKNYKKVIEQAEKHYKKYPNNIATPRVLFFAGKACEKSKQHLKAKNYYHLVLEQYPDDYYALRSKLLLDGRKTAWTLKGKKHIYAQNTNINFPITYTNTQSKEQENILFLIKNRDWRLASEFVNDNDIIKSWTNYKKGNKAISIVFARDYINKLDKKPLFSDTAYNLAYPLYYTDEINKYSKTYDLDPFLIMAIIKEESYFDTTAKSIVGASGLMQVMPDTANFISAKYNLNYSKANINDINKNIELGCAYIDYILGELSKKYLFAVAGYNGGHNAVKGWTTTLNYNDFDEYVEEIPYPETQNYIKKVFKSYWNYVNIYDQIN